MTYPSLRSLDDRLSRLSDRRFMALVYLTALALYLVGFWLHFPNAHQVNNGGNVHTDLIEIFQTRFCPTPSPYNDYQSFQPSTICAIPIPYLHSFNEYPVITAMFTYAMAVLGASLAGDLLRNYFTLTAAFLIIPTLLAVRELMKIIKIRGASRSRVLWYFVVTPTFLLMTLLNWYVIGVYFTLFGMRRYLESGSRFWSGVLFGLSAASNFVTAIPALGFFISSRTMKERITLAGAAIGTYAAINAPFIILNSGLWLKSWHYIYTWNIENSWMQGILIDLYSPYRHFIPPIVFGGFFIGMLWMRRRGTTSDPLVFAFVAMFGYTFATYIYTPQMNLILLPFFVLLPVTGSYGEFLAFDLLNASIIILGTSDVFLPLGISYYPLFHPINYKSVVFWIEVVRSLWQGKFALVNDIPGSLSLPWWKREKEGLAMATGKDALLREPHN